MPPLHRRVLPATLMAAVPLVLAAPALGATSPDRFMGEVHADLVTEQGTRVAAISGSVGRTGLGYGDIVPLNGARGVGMRRPERVRLYAMNNTTVVAIGQHGTRLTFSDRGHGEMTNGYGALRTSRSKRVAVNARGFWNQKPFLPARGQRMLLIGKVKGTLRTALSRRYTLVGYSSAKYSRTALINNPSRYRTIAGIIVGSGVSASQLAKLDLARSLHNDGRLVATTLRNGMLDRHMYVVSHAHTGQGGVILRREVPRLGYQVHSYPQIREPIITNSRVGAAKAKSEAATFTPEVKKRALDAAVRSLGAALVKAERLAPLPTPPKGKKGKRKGEMQGATVTSPATVSAGSDDAAFYTVPVNQYISATINAPSVYAAGTQEQTYNWTTGYLQYVPASAAAVSSSSSASSTSVGTEDEESNTDTTNWTMSIPYGASGVATQLIPVVTSQVVSYPLTEPPALAQPTGYPSGACQKTMQYTYSDKGDIVGWANQWSCAPTPATSIWGACTVAYANTEGVQAVNGPPAMNAPLPITMLVAKPSQWVPAEVLWKCDNFPNPTIQDTTLTQTVGLTYNPIYTVSLAQSTTEVTTQAITETNAAQFNALATASTPMGAGTYAAGTGMTSAGLVAGQPETAFGLALAYHSVSLDCSACKGINGGSVTPAFVSNGSSPTQQVTQVQASSATGTSTDVTAGASWSQSTSSESGWSVSGNAGMFGETPNAGISGGYSQSTTTTDTSGGSIGVSQGTQLTSSASFTSSNWVTTPFQGENQAAYTTYSTTVTGASGSAANAAYSLPFPAALMGNGNSTGYIPTPSQYGGSGPGPQCTPGPACGAPDLSPQPTGSNENLTGFSQGSTSFFNLDTAQNQLATGSALPWVNDTFYLFDSGTPIIGANLGAYIEMQVLGQSQVSVYQPSSSQANGATFSTSNTGASGAAAITTYYNGQGQVVNGASGSTYQTTGLDLCAPPVLTPALWDGGCENDPNFSGPPAVYQATPPNITTASTTNPIQFSTTGQAEVTSPAPLLTCNPGTWTGSPSFTYLWQQWSPTMTAWQPPVTPTTVFTTDPTFTPPASLSASGSPYYFTCVVKATNGMGSTTQTAASVAVVVDG